MRQRNWLKMALFTTLAFALVVLPALAGEKGHKCPLDTQTCLNKMVAQMKTRGWVGIEMEDNKDPRIVTIKRVVPGSPAEAAGFKAGDVLVALNGIKYADNTEERCLPCEAMKDNWVPGRKVQYVVNRSGAEVKLDVTLAPVPTDVMAQWIGAHMIEHAQVEIAQK